MSKMKKILLFLVFIGLIASVKYVLFDFPVSTGKRAGNLAKMTKRGKFIKTWEGTIDEGSGDKLTTDFSVADEALGQELFEYEGREVIIYYTEHFVAFPYETTSIITSWTPKEGKKNHQTNLNEKMLSRVEETLFCSLLGALRVDQDLYLRVKNFVKENNHYLFQQYARCNEI